mgnify:CR=1 FL=1
MLAAGLAAGLPLESATSLANMAAGVVVAKLGTASVSVEELQQALQEHQVVRRGIVGEDDLAGILAAARKRGERIVFTNGCFDILHPGHVTYLEEASRLGDRLVVAVNTDESVRKLKGTGRPVNPLEGRMTVLAALSCVDWVLPFGEDTPERLICRLLPDYLVKGGDNDPDRIPGGGCVREAGGEVIGITTEAFPQRTPNPYLTTERRQPTLLDRIRVLIQAGDAYVVLPGGIGTIAELMMPHRPAMVK